MANVLITGISGQDGSYLADLLKDNGDTVIGISRTKYKNNNDYKMESWNYQDNSIKEIIKKNAIDEVYNFAAYSSGMGMYDDPIAISEINGIAVLRILEAIRDVNLRIKFCQASSSEMFGIPTEMPQNELSAFNPRSPYGVAKLFAHEMIRIYREKYGIFACSAILYNHESPRRRIEFVTRKITNTAVKIKLGLASELFLGNLSSVRDWGFAGDYVRAMRLMLLQETAEDYVIATGEAHTVREFCELSFGYLGLDYRDYVKVDKNYYRENEKKQLIGCSDKAKKNLKWEPNIKLDELIKIMIDHDLKEYNI